VSEADGGRAGAARDAIAVPALDGPEAPVPVVLCHTGALAGAHRAPGGALWRLAEPGRQLDANLVHLPPRRRVAAHTEPDVDVLLLVVAGGGTVDGARGPQRLTPGTLLWLPHGSRRGLSADENGLTYLTVHRRRPGMRIRRRDPNPDPALDPGDRDPGVDVPIDRLAAWPARLDGERRRTAADDDAGRR
jgi:quercetin dioxygenase-like cupin family protein